MLVSLTLAPPQGDFNYEALKDCSIKLFFFSHSVNKPELDNLKYPYLIYSPRLLYPQILNNSKINPGDMWVLDYLAGKNCFIKYNQN